MATIPDLPQLPVVPRVIVQKYGGSSVADVAKIQLVAKRIAETHRSGSQVVAVVSAMGKTTDQLLQLAHEVTDEPDRRELDMLLSAGERISMALVAMAVRGHGLKATSLTGSQCGILTTDNAGNARIVEVRPFRVQDALDQGEVVIVAGFQGTSWRREITTLGRGGSDTTAVALAAALGADCEIYSDIDGIYSADPRQVPNATRLDSVTHDETLAMARAGAKVLAADAVALARMHGIALYARKTGQGSGETVVRLDTPRDRPWIVGVASRPHAVALQYTAQAALDQQLGSLWTAANLTEVASMQAQTRLVVLARDVADAVDPAFDRAIAQAVQLLGHAELTVLRGTLVSIVGPAVGREPGLLGQFVALVSEATEAAPMAVVAHGLTLSALVAPEHTGRVLAALHRRFVEVTP